MNQSVSQYCERASSAFWAEPVNALTNGAFALAALLLVWWLWRRGRGRGDWDLWCLTALIACIAVGSFLWHTLAVPWSAAADVAPILLFVSLYLVVFLRRAAGWSLGWALLALVGLEAANVALPLLFPGALNGSIGYVPTWLGMAVLAFIVRGGRASRVLLMAFAVFTVSLTLRSLDQWACPSLGTGTHPAWHVLNAVVLYLAVVAAHLGGVPRGRRLRSIR